MLATAGAALLVYLESSARRARSLSFGSSITRVRPGCKVFELGGVVCDVGRYFQGAGESCLWRSSGHENDVCHPRSGFSSVHLSCLIDPRMASNGSEQGVDANTPERVGRVSGVYGGVWHDLDVRLPIDRDEVEHAVNVWPFEAFPSFRP